MSARTLCELCHEVIDPLDRNTMRSVAGWQHRAGGQLVLKVELPAWAHRHCVELAQLDRTAAQQSFGV